MNKQRNFHKLNHLNFFYKQATNTPCISMCT